jgi:pimeloyl-ACP methyl ester carboxylesterase
VSRALHPPAQTMPGLLVAVGDHRLHLHCTGTGGPTVVLEPGLGGVSTDLHGIAAAVARDTRVCVYDRAGRGWSEDAAGPQDAIHVAADLRTLLDHADVPGPYVLAGHSFGGLYSLSFAAQFPDQVAGMVLLDSTAPRPAPAGAPSQSNVLGRVAILMGSLGDVAAGPEHASFLQEFLEGSASVQEAAALTNLHGKPLTTLSTNSLHRFAHATHQSLVADQVASAAASSAIREVVASLRAFQPLNSR